MVTADAVVINCPQGCVLQMAALPQFFPKKSEMKNFNFIFIYYDFYLKFSSSEHIWHKFKAGGI